LQELPYALRNRIFEKLFHVAEIAKMLPKEKRSYNQSLKEYRDMYLMENALKKKEALLQEKENVIQGMHGEIQGMYGEIQGMYVLIQGKDAVIQEKNLALRKKDETMVRVLLEAGLTAKKIAESTGLSMTEINRIKDTL